MALAIFAFFSHFCDLVPSGNPITHKFDRQHHDLSQLVHHLPLELVRGEGGTKRVKKFGKRAEKSQKESKRGKKRQKEAKKSNRIEVRPCLLILSPSFAFRLNFLLQIVFLI